MDIIKGLLLVIHTIGWIGALTCENTYSHNRRFQIFIAMTVVTFLLYLVVLWID